MGLDHADDALARIGPRLSPYLRRALDEAAERALALHADAVALEHLVGALLEDEESALHRLTVHAFADPETIAADVLALAPGILVVGSDATLAFSPAAVSALRAARERAHAAGAARVEPADVLAEAERALPEALRAKLVEAGYRGEPLAPESAPAGAPGIELGANLFHSYADEARRLLSRAGRAAVRAGEAAIGPARLLLAALEADVGLEARSGLSRSRARLVLEGRTEDPTRPEERALGLEPALAALLAALPEGAASLDLLEHLHQDPSSELTQAFTRQKVSAALVDRARGAFRDPPS